MEQRVKRKRCQIACKRCNERRVRCDASTRGLPCSNCVAGHLEASCHFIDSKRSRGERGRFMPARTAEAATIPFNRSIDVNANACNIVRHGQLAYDNASASRNSLHRDQIQLQVQDAKARPIDTGQTDQADQWSRIISNDHSHMVTSGQVAYLGEAWTLSYVFQLKLSGGFGAASMAGGLHLALPAEPVDKSKKPNSPELEPSRQSSKDKTPSVPADIQAALVDAYFAHNHTIYPILCQTSFRHALAIDHVSNLLLLSVLYAGALHVNEAVIYRLGFNDRLDCLKTFYQRAKAVFDADTEKDRVSVVQSAFLLHNWWQSPTATMDPWTWLGLAIRLAQNMGMHRSTKQSPLPPQEKSLWKRIWWCLYARDRQIAAALGKPLMIHDVDCDVEPLTKEDFEPSEPVVVRLFVIQQVKLSTLFGLAISSRFCPRYRNEPGTSTDMIRMQHRIQKWQDQLPPELRYHESGDEHGSHGGMHYSLQTLLLHSLFNYLVILLQRPKAIPRQSTSIFDFDDSVSCEIAFDAATSSTRIAEMIMNEYSLNHCPLFFTSALFSAMTMHALKGPKAERELNVCMIAMRTLSTMYSAAGWIRLLFQKLIEKKRDRTKSNRSSNHGGSKDQQQRQHTDINSQESSSPESRGRAGAESDSILPPSRPLHFQPSAQQSSQQDSSSPTRSMAPFEFKNSNDDRNLRDNRNTPPKVIVFPPRLQHQPPPPPLPPPPKCITLLEQNSTQGSDCQQQQQQQNLSSIPTAPLGLPNALPLTPASSAVPAPGSRLNHLNSNLITSHLSSTPPDFPGYSDVVQQSALWEEANANVDTDIADTSMNMNTNTNTWDIWHHLSGGGGSYFIGFEGGYNLNINYGPAHDHSGSGSVDANGNQYSPPSSSALSYV